MQYDSVPEWLTISYSMIAYQNGPLSYSTIVCLNGQLMYSMKMAHQCTVYVYHSNLRVSAAVVVVVNYGGFLWWNTAVAIIVAQSVK